MPGKSNNSPGHHNTIAHTEVLAPSLSLPHHIFVLDPFQSPAGEIRPGVRDLCQKDRKASGKNKLCVSSGGKTKGDLCVPSIPLSRPFFPGAAHKMASSSLVASKPQRQRQRDKSNNKDVLLWVTYTNIVLYALSYQLQTPVEPFLIQQLLEKQQQQQEDGGGGNTTTTSLNDTYASVQSFFQAIQFCGSPLVGLLLDKYGIRVTSTIVFAASAASYALLSVATTLPLLLASKVPTVFQAAFLVAQATAAAATTTSSGKEDEKEDDADHDDDGKSATASAAKDTTSSTTTTAASTSASASTTERAAALGRMTTAYTIGATLGPTIGGYLAQNSSSNNDDNNDDHNGNLYLGARLAVVGSLISVALSLWYLPGKSTSNDNEGKEGQDADKADDNTPPSSSSSSSSMWSLLTRASLWPLLTVKFVGGIVASIHGTAMPLLLTSQSSSSALQWEPAQLGLQLSATMLAVAVFAAVGMAPVSRALGGPDRMARAGLMGRASFGVAMAAMVSWITAMTTTTTSSSWTTMLFLHRQQQRGGGLVPIVAVSVGHALASHMLATGLTTQTTGAVAAVERGTLLGIEHALFSLSRIVGPKVATLLLALNGNGDNGDDDGNGDSSLSLWNVEAVCGVCDVLLVLLLLVTAATTTTVTTSTTKKVKST